MVDSPVALSSRVDSLPSEALDDILSRWHAWQHGEKVGRGHSNAAIVCGEYRVSRQYDDSNGKLDDDLHAFQSRQVNTEVRKMEDPWRTAIYVNARNINTGHDVWISPRLPEGKTAREKIVAQARGQLTRLLKSAGVL